jgi:hypothetical protein
MLRGTIMPSSYSIKKNKTRRNHVGFTQLWMASPTLPSMGGLFTIPVVAKCHWVCDITYQDLKQNPSYGVTITNKPATSTIPSSNET